MDIPGQKRAKPIIIIPNANPVEHQIQEYVPVVRAQPAPIVVGPARTPMPENPAARQIAADAAQRLMARMNGEAPPVEPPRVVRAHVREDPRPRLAVPAYEDLNQNQRDEIFWEIIDRLQWRNTSDGYVNARQIQNIIRGLNPTQERVFREKYNDLFDVMKNRLEADGMFGRNGIISPVDQAKIISHAIAMGKDQFFTLLDDLAIYQFLIELGECQSLDIHLPDNMQH